MRTRSMLMVLLLLAGIGVVSWQQAPRAAACSCVAQSVTEHAESADLVAEGVVVGVDRPENPQTSMDDATYTVELTRLWKGPEAPQVAVLSPVSGASCGLEGLSEGMTIALFSRDDNGVWRSDLCDGTGPMTEAMAAELSAAEGEPTVLTPSADSSTAPSPGPDNGSPAVLYTALGVAGVALLALVVLGWVRRRRSD
ncbi:hypothetical protein [Tessaracoccus sp. MC1756]|uniref:hypothetical protein n=1 Tax=Tessaracoccus sp. MC1756 TaxID=2760311 RepID=UPI0015FFACDB|nr:hypothetical protein [Tessaracoccus sp. MC1756]MBB1510316.1 hypothetical protein [Tessaracoccus sp. MC1756]